MPARVRFLCDVMLGRLARWLRGLGYDTAYERSADDRDLLVRAGRERRWLLTRDTGIVPPPEVRVLVLRSDAPIEQVREVITALGGIRPRRLFSRCTLCNTVLRRARPEQIAARVPDFVRSAHAVFRACPDCGRVYWPGTHRLDMERRLGSLSRDTGADGRI